MTTTLRPLSIWHPPPALLATVLLATVLLVAVAAAPARAQEPAGVDDVPESVEAAPGDVPAGRPPESPFSLPLLIGGMLLFLYFAILRPQNKERAAREKLVASLKPHAEVVTIGGIHGKIVKAADGSATVTIQVDQNTRLTVNRDAVREVVTDDAAGAAKDDAAAES